MRGLYILFVFAYAIALTVVRPALGSYFYPDVAQQQQRAEAQRAAEQKKRMAAEAHARQQHAAMHEANVRRQAAFDAAHPEIVAERKAKAAAAAASAAAAEQQKLHEEHVIAEAAAESSDSSENCDRASKLENQAANEINADSYQSTYDTSVHGLVVTEHCSDDTVKMINKGYFLSFKALAEHHLSSGDSQTDMNEANQLLVQCQTTPGIYGTHTAALCESQETNNIQSQTNWEMGE